MRNQKRGEYTFLNDVIKKAHDQKGMRFYEELSKEYQGDSWEKKCLDRFYNYLLTRNKIFNKRVFGIDRWVVKDFLENV